jgi:hypothetical protein
VKGCGGKDRLDFLQLFNNQGQNYKAKMQEMEFCLI